MKARVLRGWFGSFMSFGRLISPHPSRLPKRGASGIPGAIKLVLSSCLTDHTAWNRWPEASHSSRCSGARVGRPQMGEYSHDHRQILNVDNVRIVFERTQSVRFPSCSSGQIALIERRSAKLSAVEFCYTDFCIWPPCHFKKISRIDLRNVR